MPTPSLWQPPTQRVEPSEKKSLRQIPSSNASPSLILGPGRTAKCVDFMGARHAGRCDRWIGSSVSRKLLQSLFINAEPGSILVGRQRELCRAWPNQPEARVKGRDPIGSGFVASFPRPGGNATGFAV